MPDINLVSRAQDIAVSLIVSLIVFASGFLAGKWRTCRQRAGRNLEQYEFYPFAQTRRGSRSSASSSSSEASRISSRIRTVRRRAR